MLKNGKRLAAALDLVARRRVFHPAEVELIVGAADELLAERETYNRTESRLLDIADNLRVRSFSEPRVATPFDVKIDEAAAALVPATEGLQAAQAAVDAAVRALGTAEWETAALGQRTASDGTSTRDRDAALQDRADLEAGLRERLREARAELAAADAAWLRANSRHIALQLAADRWRAVEEYTATSRR